MIERIDRSTIETGVVIATCAITERTFPFITDHRSARLFVSIMFYDPISGHIQRTRSVNMLGKIYSNALLTSLNARQSITAGVDEAPDVSSPISAVLCCAIKYPYHWQTHTTQ